MVLARGRKQQRRQEMQAIIRQAGNYRRYIPERSPSIDACSRVEAGRGGMEGGFGNLNGKSGGKKRKTKAQ